MKVMILLPTSRFFPQQMVWSMAYRLRNVIVLCPFSENRKCFTFLIMLITDLLPNNLSKLMFS